ncbi:hypothetical protein [Terricaulis silvestris]|uniref:hypothetical protein n=1 Tax=Terricaulis silvestris TaxID=2686094 RepID=UPI00131C1FD7|nr:hypothetical protein [Terricaulis silvestris]
MVEGFGLDVAQNIPGNEKHPRQRKLELFEQFLRHPLNAREYSRWKHQAQLDRFGGIS